MSGVRGNAAPPTRLRNIVGSAIDSLSRLRRPPIAPLAIEPPRHEPAADDPGVRLSDVRGLHPAEGVFDQAVAHDDPRDDEEAPPASPCAPIPGAVAVAETAPSIPHEPDVPQIDFARLAEICLAISRLQDARDLQPALNDVVTLLNGAGLIVWIWDDVAQGLRPALASGYSPRVLTHLPTVSAEADNATAAAFRSTRICLMRGAGQSNGALAVPLMAGSGCIGVLALEFADGAEQEEAVRAAASIVAAMLALWIFQLGFVEEPAVGAEGEEAPRQRRTS